MNRRDFFKKSILTIPFLILGSSLFCKKKEGNGLPEKLLRLKDKKNPTLSEKKHVPGIEAPANVKANEWFKIKVSVGYMVLHPSSNEHWITGIKLLVDKKEYASAEFVTGGKASPVVEFNIKIGKTSVIEAVENCNIHGTWISEPYTITAG